MGNGMFILIKELEYGCGLYGIKALSRDPKHLNIDRDSLVREHIAEATLSEAMLDFENLVFRYEGGKLIVQDA